MRKALLGLILATSILAVTGNEAQAEHGKAGEKATPCQTKNTTQAQLAGQSNGLELVFHANSNERLTDQDKSLITRLIADATGNIRTLLDDLPTNIRVELALVDRNLDKVGGVTGHADNPNLVVIEISTRYPGGVAKAIQDGLVPTIYHEFHHLARGWTLKGNKFGPGIPIAAVNEGLAIVFADQYSGNANSWTRYPESVSGWLDEVLNLPTNASYEMWMMGQHPDGRENIGYRLGKYITHQAMAKTGLDIIELSQLSPYEILDIGGLINEHAASLGRLGDYFAKQQLTEKALVSYQRAYDTAQKGKHMGAEKYRNKIQLLQNPVVLSEAMLDAYTGSYESRQFKFEISRQGRQLMGEMAGRPPFKLYAKSETSFYIYEADVKFEFKRHAQDNKTQLVFHTPDKAFEINKVN